MAAGTRDTAWTSAPGLKKENLGFLENDVSTLPQKNSFSNHLIWRPLKTRSHL
jgi:hypothetical protein